MIDVETFAAAKAYTDKQGGGSGDGDMKKSVYDSDLAVANAGGISAFVGNAVDEVKSKSWSLGGGTSIANNTDLNNITTVGNYYATTPAAATLSHCPITGAFKLKVLYDVRESAPTYIEQVFNPISSYDEYRRYKSGSAEWSDWHLTNCNLDEVKGKVADNTGAIEAIVNVTGAKNIANNDATTKTDSGVLFTVNADKSVTVQRQSSTTDPYSYISLFNNKTLPAIPLILSGCPNVTGLTLYLYDKTTSTRYNQTGDEIEVTPVVGHTYSLVIEALNSADLDTAVTVYPMIRDARITDSTYVPYAMTNKELTESVGALSNLNTTAKNNLVTAVNEVNGKVINFLHDSWHGLTLNETKIGNLYIATISGTTTEDVPAWSQIGLNLLSSNNVCFGSNTVFVLQGFVIKNSTNLTVNTYYDYMLVCLNN